MPLLYYFRNCGLASQAASLQLSPRLHSHLSPRREHRAIKTRGALASLPSFPSLQAHCDSWGGFGPPARGSRGDLFEWPPWLLTAQLLPPFRGAGGRRWRITAKKLSTRLGFLAGKGGQSRHRKSALSDASKGERVFFCGRGAWLSFGGGRMLVEGRGLAAVGVNILFYIGHLLIFSICVAIKGRRQLGLGEE